MILSGKDGHPKASILNQRLANLKKAIDEKLDRLLVGKNQVIPVPVLRSILNGDYEERMEKNNGKVSFVEFVLDQNKELYEIGKIGYSVWENIRCHMKRFREFLQQEKRLDTNEKTILYCRDITVQVMKEYIKWRQGKKNSFGGERAESKIGLSFCVFTIPFFRKILDFNG